jgi:PTH1 family peptidyl-tRNA hydrolase
MKLIVGLGNPGSEYAKTRHNAGFMFVDYVYDHNEVIKSWKFDKYSNSELAVVIFQNEETILVKPQTFMNKSGHSVVKLAITYKIQPTDCFIAHDDLDFKLGDFKISLGKGPKLHNGITSIEELWKTKNFWRIRIGVDNRNEPIPGDTYVLRSFDVEELSSLYSVFQEILNIHLSKL